MRYYGIIIYYYVLLLLFIIIRDCSAEALVLDFTTNCESSGSTADDAEAAFSAQAKFQESCSAATPSVQPGQYHLPIDKKKHCTPKYKKNICKVSILRPGINGQTFNSQIFMVAIIRNFGKILFTLSLQ